MSSIQKKKFATVAGVSLFAIVFLVWFQPIYHPKFIDWNPFSISEIHEDLDDGKVILVSVMASWGISTVIHEARYSTDPAILKLVRKKSIACYQVDLAEIPVDQIPYWRTYFNDEPILGLLLLSKKSRHKVVLRSIPDYEVTAERVITEIEKLQVLKD